MTAATSRISLLDLAAGDVERIETDLGLPVNRWSEAPSVIAVYVKIAAAATGETEETYRAMPLSRLMKLVDLDGTADPNP